MLAGAPARAARGLSAAGIRHVSPGRRPQVLAAAQPQPQPQLHLLPAVCAAARLLPLLARSSHLVPSPSLLLNSPLFSLPHPLRTTSTPPARPPAAYHPQIQGLAVPLAYVVTVSCGVAAYYTAAAVSGLCTRGSCLQPGCRLSVTAAPVGIAPCVVPHLHRLDRRPRLPHNTPAAAPCRLPPASFFALPQKGMLPLYPALKVLASAPFSLTSFALSLLLVFR